MNYIVLDLEFNQPFSFKPGVKAAADPVCPFEIIQIGAVKLDSAFQEAGRFGCYIKPQIYKRIHPFVEKITGITKAMVKDAQAFPEAYAAFLAFIGTEESALCTWGGDDVKSLLRNVLYHKQDLERLPKSCLNVQPLASQFLEQDPGKCIGLKNAVELLNIPVEEAFHDALSDAVYTARILQLVHPQQIKPDTIQVDALLAPKQKKLRVNTKGLLAHFRNSYGRELTEDEANMIKQAYRLGRNQAFDMGHKKAEKKE